MSRFVNNPFFLRFDFYREKNNSNHREVCRDIEIKWDCLILFEVESNMGRVFESDFKK